VTGRVLAGGVADTKQHRGRLVQELTRFNRRVLRVDVRRSSQLRTVDFRECWHVPRLSPEHTFRAGEIPSPSVARRTREGRQTSRGRRRPWIAPSGCARRPCGRCGRGETRSSWARGTGLRRLHGCWAHSRRPARHGARARSVIAVDIVPAAPRGLAGAPEPDLRACRPRRGAELLEAVDREPVRLARVAPPAGPFQALGVAEQGGAISNRLVTTCRCSNAAAK
jgi:hypothetical protein